jgi:hypothetical protein
MNRTPNLDDFPKKEESGRNGAYLRRNRISNRFRVIQRWIHFPRRFAPESRHQQTNAPKKKKKKKKIGGKRNRETVTKCAPHQQGHDPNCLRRHQRHRSTFVSEEITESDFSMEYARRKKKKKNPSRRIDHSATSQVSVRVACGLGSEVARRPGRHVRDIDEPSSKFPTCPPVQPDSSCNVIQ